MSAAAELTREAAKQVAVVHSKEALTRFLQPDCAAAVWQRELTPEFTAWIASLAKHHLPEGRLVLPANRIADAVAQLCDAANMPDGEQRKWLISDIAELGERFAQIMGVDHVRLRLERVSDNACSKFHIDTMVARLVCTYRGTGTQYGLVTLSPDPDHIATTPAGSPLLLKGHLWPDAPPAHFKHRSPPIEGSGETRLVLVLDPGEE
ncbi:MAG: DUF1826 domain-containing protein [Pseudomonadota bacterium]